MDLQLELHGLLSACGGVGMLVALVACYTLLDMLRGAQASRAGVAGRWLACGGAAFATAVMPVHVLLTASLDLGFTLGYHPAGAMGAYLLAAMTGFCALGCGVARVAPRWRALAAGSALGVAIVACQLLALQTMGLSPGLRWQWPALAMATAVASGFSIFGLWLFMRRRRVPSTESLRRRFADQALPALSLAVAVICSQVLVIDGSDFPSQIFSAYRLDLPSNTLLMLASFGSLSLLAVMLVSSALEARMRAALRDAKEEIQKQSVTDALTELPNRVMFEGALAKAVCEADATNAKVVLLFIDLDGFKPINELFGHHSGDRMLREIGTRIGALARPGDAVARLGADEFLMLLTGSVQHADVTRLAERVLEAVNRSCSLNGRDASVTASIGIAVYPEHGPAEMLIAHAEAAMRVAKGGGGANHCRFESHMMGDVRDQVELLRDLRHALARGQLQLYYQPKVHAPSGEVTGAEALMRWHHPTRGMVGPGVFIPIAERHGLIGALGNWVIDEACRQAAYWRGEGLRMRIAINLSVHQLRQPDLVQRIDAALRRHAVKPDVLTCEITESVAMEDPEGTMKTFERLAGIGVHISIDDFGTGYSSLSYLRRLPAGELKIDRSFVFDLESSADARAIVDAVVKLAQALGLKVVAEGVETEAQHEILRSLGCDELQGFLFARPMAPTALSEWALADTGRKVMDFQESRFRETAAGAFH
jgi:diguanylate cyclase (GGDEF)-like protein